MTSESTDDVVHRCATVPYIITLLNTIHTILYMYGIGYTILDINHCLLDDNIQLAKPTCHHIYTHSMAECCVFNSCNNYIRDSCISSIIKIALIKK